MSTALQYILVTLALLSASLLIKLLISLLFSFARVYTTVGSRLLKGYLVKNRQGDFVLYSGLVPLLRRRKGIVINQSEIQLEQQNDEHNHAEMPAGFFDQNPASVTDQFGTYVADVEPSGARNARAVAGDIETAFAKGSIRSKGELSPFAAAVGALLKAQADTVKHARTYRCEHWLVHQVMQRCYLLEYPHEERKSESSKRYCSCESLA